MPKKLLITLIVLILAFSFGCAPPKEELEAELNCTIAVTCHELAADPSVLEPDKQELVPEDGFILPLTPVLFFPEEDACNLLIRTLRASGIQIDVEKMPGTGDYYVKGINNLYEMEAGSFSGWICKVNDEILDYSSSAYLLQEGDAVEFFYAKDYSIYW